MNFEWQQRDHHEVLLCQLAVLFDILRVSSNRGVSKVGFAGNFEMLASTGKCSRSKGGLANLSAAKLAKLSTRV